MEEQGNKSKKARITYKTHCPAYPVTPQKTQKKDPVTPQTKEKKQKRQPLMTDKHIFSRHYHAARLLYKGYPIEEQKRLATVAGWTAIGEYYS
eukprot:15689965-Heterocapsa_arctica.AAC.1